MKALLFDMQKSTLLILKIAAGGNISTSTLRTHLSVQLSKLSEQNEKKNVTIIEISMSILI